MSCILSFSSSLIPIKLSKNLPQPRGKSHQIPWECDEHNVPPLQKNWTIAAGQNCRKSPKTAAKGPFDLSQWGLLQ